MKHEYSSDELRELKSIYDESGEAGLSRDEMRALRKAGLVKQDLPPEPEKPHEDTLADYQAVSKPRTSALDIANLVVNYFDADIIKADINKPSNQQGA